MKRIFTLFVFSLFAINAGAQLLDCNTIIRTNEVTDRKRKDTIMWYAGECVDYIVYPEQNGQPVTMPTNSVPVWFATDRSLTNYYVIRTGSVDGVSIRFNLPVNLSALTPDKYESVVNIYGGNPTGQPPMIVADRVQAMVLWGADFTGVFRGPISPTNAIVLDANTTVLTTFWTQNASNLAAALNIYDATSLQTQISNLTVAVNTATNNLYAAIVSNDVDILNLQGLGATNQQNIALNAGAITTNATMISIAQGKADTNALTISALISWNEAASNKANAAYGWGDHGAVGYALDTDLDLVDGKSSTNSANIDSISNLAVTAHGWGNHADVGYLRPSTNALATGSWVSPGIGGDSSVSNSATYGTVGGGNHTTVGGAYGTVAGGQYNNAGKWASIPGGTHNMSTGQLSFAAGTAANAKDYGSFVWSSPWSVDYLSPDVTGGMESQGDLTFNVQAWGGTYFKTPTFTFLDLSGNVMMIIDAQSGEVQVGANSFHMTASGDIYQTDPTNTAHLGMLRVNGLTISNDPYYVAIGLVSSNNAITQGKADTNTTLIAINTDAIASNDTDILNLQGLGVTNQAGIAINSGAITTNTTLTLIAQGKADTNTTLIAINTDAIASNDTDILNLQGLGSTNQTGIAINSGAITTNVALTLIAQGKADTNTTLIAINTAAIASNDTDILNLQGLGATNQTGIAINSGAITTNTTLTLIAQGKADTNTTLIAINTDAIASNDTDILNLQGLGATNQTGIAINAGAITTNTTLITIAQGKADTNTTLIAMNAAAIASNDTDILNLQGLGATNQTGIAINSGAITTNVALTLIAQGKADTNTTLIAINTAAITSNDTDILNLQGLGSTNQADIAVNASAINIAQGKADTNTTLISINADAIASNDTDILNLQGLGNTNQGAIVALYLNLGAAVTNISTNTNARLLGGVPLSSIVRQTDWQAEMTNDFSYVETWPIASTNLGVLWEYSTRYNGGTNEWAVYVPNALGTNSPGWIYWGVETR